MSGINRTFATYLTGLFENGNQSEIRKNGGKFLAVPEF